MGQQRLSSSRHLAGITSAAVIAAYLIGLWRGHSLHTATDQTSDPKNGLSRSKVSINSAENVPHASDTATHPNLTARALEELARMPAGAEQNSAYEQMFCIWAEKDPLATLNAANALAIGPIRDSARKGFVKGSLKVDPEATMAWAAGLPPRDAKILQLAVSQVTSIDPPLAARFVDKISNAKIRAMAIQDIAHAWAGGVDATWDKADPAAALDWLNREAPEGVYSRAVSDVFATIDIPTATTFVGSVSDSDVRAKVIAQLAQTWGTIDPKGTLAWLQSLPAEDALPRQGTILAILTQWGNIDPRAAISFVQQSAEPALYLSAIPALAQSLARSDPQLALNISSALPTAAGRSQAIAGILSTYAQADFNGAWQYASNLPDDGSRQLALVGLVGKLANKNPAQAAQIAGALPQGPVQTEAVCSVASAWGPQDPYAFSQWVSQISDSSTRNSAIAAAIDAIKAIELRDSEKNSLIQAITKNSLEK